MTKPNGHDRSSSALRGQALPLSSREVRGAQLAPGGAASDDARAFPNASGASAPAGMERDACAEAAPPREGRKRKIRAATNAQSNGSHDAALAKVDEVNVSRKGSESAAVDIPPGIEPLAADGPGFVDTMHAHVDLYLACARLVKSSDEKIAQRMVERLLEMSYGKSPSQTSEDATPTTFGTPSPAQESV
jgi:hypothetical protein